MVCRLDTIGSAKMIMQRDADLLANLGSSPILHLYEWESPSITYGHFISPEKHLQLQALAEEKIAIARRPTGGGIVFHLWDYAFSFLMPSSCSLFSLNTLDNYKFVNDVVLSVVGEMFDLKGTALIEESYPIGQEGCQHFCMARPTHYDVVYRGRKIAGAAQRRTKKGYLHQGTISLIPPDIEILKKILVDKGEIVQAMERYSFGLTLERDVLGVLRAQVGQKLFAAFFKIFCTQ